MSAIKLIVCLAALAIIVPSAFSYGPKGHTLVGLVADQELLGHKAGDQVKQLLGGNLTLGTVATWADDIKSGDIADADMNEFRRSHMKKLGTETEHKAFHFVDIPFQEKAYSDKSVGARPYDLVHAINDCIYILKNQATGAHPNDGYFDDVPPRVALILLAHYVGDLHQPLHVGSGYISEDLEFVDPDQQKGAQADSDQGGNLLKFQSGELHAYWDTGAVVSAMGKALTQAHKPKGSLPAYADILHQKTAPPITDGDVLGWASQWATEILPYAAQAHDVIITGPVEIKSRYGTTDGWGISPPDEENWRAYESNAAKVVDEELSKGGYRLAQICEQIWPD